MGEVTTALTKALGLSEKAVAAGKKWAAHADTPEERDYIVKGVHAMTLVVGDTLQAWSGKLDAAQKAMAGWEVGIVKRRDTKAQTVASSAR